MTTQEQITELEEHLETLNTTEELDIEVTQKAINDALEAAKKQGTPTFSGLRVSWVQDFEEVVLEFKGDLTEPEMQKCFQGMPVACTRKLREGMGTPKPGSPRTIKADFRRRHDARASRRSGFTERLRRLKTGTEG